MSSNGFPLRRAAGRAAAAAGSDDAPLDLLLRMMLDRDVSSRERIDIAKVCLPFVHPRIAQLSPSEMESGQDICDPDYMRSLANALLQSLAVAVFDRREISAAVWDSMKCMPRGPDELKRWVETGQI